MGPSPTFSLGIWRKQPAQLFDQGTGAQKGAALWRTWQLGVPCVGHPTQGLQKPCSRRWPRSPLSRFFLPPPLSLRPLLGTTCPHLGVPGPSPARHQPHPGAQRQESPSRPLPPLLHLAGRVRPASGPLSGTPKCYKQGTQPMEKEPLDPPHPLPKLPPKTKHKNIKIRQMRQQRS